MLQSNLTHWFDSIHMVCAQSSHTSRSDYHASKSALERLFPLSHLHKVPSEGILVQVVSSKYLVLISVSHRWVCHSLKSDHDLASESPDSLPEFCQSEPKTFDHVALELELSEVSEDDADSESMSMDDKSWRVPQRPVWLKLQSRPALCWARHRW